MKRTLTLLLTCCFFSCIEVSAAPKPVTKVATKPKIEPAAVALLDKSAKAYAALKGLAMDFETFDTSEPKGGTYYGKIAFSRPDSARMEYKRRHGTRKVVADNGKMYQKRNGKKYRVVYLLEYSGIESVLHQVPNSLSIPLAPLSVGKNPLTMGYDFVWGLRVEWESARVLADKSVVMTMKKTAESPQFEFRLFFDKTNMLLRRVEGAGTIEGKKAFDIITISNLRINPQFAPNEFKYVPASGEIADVVKPYYDPRIKVGGKPFPLFGADLAKYRSKVLLLEFTGSKSYPFPTGSPSIQRVYKKYHAKGFEVIGIRYHENQAQLDKWAKSSKIAWPQILELRKSPKSNARRYGIEKGYLDILIGRDGKITAINPRTAELEGEVVKALK